MSSDAHESRSSPVHVSHDVYDDLPPLPSPETSEHIPHLLDLTPTFTKPARRAESPEPQTANQSRLTQPQLVERIIAINPSATIGFLAKFGREPLADYLDHLILTTRPRGRQSIWERRGDTPGIMVQDAED